MGKKTDLVQNTIDSFPPVFGLRAFPGVVFRLSRTHSRLVDGRVMLYTESKREAWWCLHTRGTESELRRQLIPINEMREKLIDALAKVDEEIARLSKKAG